MRKGKISLAFAVLVVCAFAAFAYFAHSADSAMSKDGIGNPSEFIRLSHFAGIAFWAMFGFWLAGVVSAQLSPPPFRSCALFAIGLLMPIALSVLYFGSLVLQ
jgi:uncharacterized membrane protein YiaA